MGAAPFLAMADERSRGGAVGSALMQESAPSITS